MARSLVFGAPCQLSLLAGQEHGRTIPLTDPALSSSGARLKIFERPLLMGALRDGDPGRMVAAGTPPSARPSFVPDNPLGIAILQRVLWWLQQGGDLWRENWKARLPP